MENTERPKVLILYNRLFHYRVPIWEILSQRCDLTVTYSLGEEKDYSHLPFKVEYLPLCYGRGERFNIQKANIIRMAKSYDVIIIYGDISWLKFSTLPLFVRKKVVVWSLGVSAGYDKPFDANTHWDRIRKWFFNLCDAMVFYTDYPVRKYASMGVKPEKMFVAPNTVSVHPVDTKVEKNSLLFIGTLYRAKGLQSLLDAYYTLSKEGEELPVLNIIGKGPDYEDINTWIETNGMAGKIILRGAIYDIDEKAQYFASALACISPRQAGLSVLESMGYGVPFVTTKNAITGGEILNIHNGEDGVLMDSEENLTDVLRDISQNKEKYAAMGRRAQNFYNACRRPEHMADGLWNAIQYVLNVKPIR